jgi:hypothetical protein
MARNIFFSFDFDDVCATNIVRNSNVVRAENKRLPFRDHSLYDKVKNCPWIVQAAIDEGLEGTSVTVIANGESTYASRWVRYEIAKSLERGNALMVVDIDGVGLAPQPRKGPNPLDYMGISPWANGKGFDILEHNGSTWVSFKKLPSATRERSVYPISYYAGQPWKLLERFTYHRHWRENGVQLHFPMEVEIEAQIAGRDNLKSYLDNRSG